MTAVVRRFAVSRLACLLCILFTVGLPGIAAADLQELGSAAYEYRNRLYGVPAASGSYEEIRADLDALIAGEDQVAAETLAESMVPAGFENIDLWRSLYDIKVKLGKGLDAAYAAYLATEYAPDSTVKAEAFLLLGKALELIKKPSDALDAYDQAVSLAQNADARAAYKRLSRSIPFQVATTEIGTEGDAPDDESTGLERWVNSNAALWFDADQDGLVDLYVAGYYHQSQARFIKPEAGAVPAEESTDQGAPA